MDKIIVAELPRGSFHMILRWWEPVPGDTPLELSSANGCQFIQSVPVQSALWSQVSAEQPDRRFFETGCVVFGSDHMLLEMGAWNNGTFKIYCMAPVTISIFPTLIKQKIEKLMLHYAMDLGDGKIFGMSYGRSGIGRHGLGNKGWYRDEGLWPAPRKKR